MKTLTLKRGPALAGRRGGCHFLRVIYFEPDDFAEGGLAAEGRRVDCNIESVTGRLAGAQL